MSDHVSSGIAKNWNEYDLRLTPTCCTHAARLRAGITPGDRLRDRATMIDLRANMKTLTTIGLLRAELDALSGDGVRRPRIGLVPTMGALHDGHCSLIDRSVAECDFTVVTIFVNPTQFRPGEDLERYPRQLERDLALAAEHGADIVFTPGVQEIYPHGFSSEVAVRGISETLCGDPLRRGHGHFDGVTTVVAKLFNIVAPDRAYFGQKDAQQLAVIRQMSRDLNFRVTIVGCPTVREHDGLALSSRNAYLSDDQRTRALALSASLKAATEVVAAGTLDADEIRRIAIDELVAVDEVEYFELVNPETLEPVDRIDAPTLAVVAARVGDTRLIDNTTLEPKIVSIASPIQHPTRQGAAI